MLKLSGVHKIYKMGDQTLEVLKGIDLQIDQGDFVAIMGPSGSGKSTLMHIMGLLDNPSEGSYKVLDQEVSHLSEDQLSIFRRKLMGFIFQQFNLLPRLSASENVALPLLYSEQNLDTSKSDPILQQVGLEDRGHHRPNQLSGGQQQRVAIARALINQPLIIFADEPTGNLDSKSESEILAILEHLNEQGITLIMVTHEEEVGQRAKRVIRMRDGLIFSDLRQKPIGPSAKATSAQKFSVSSLSLREVYEYFRQGFNTLSANKVRTLLSMLGILIGVASVVAMLALGSGAQKAIEEQLTSLGSNLLVLRPGSIRVGGVAQGSGSTNRLNLDDLTFLKDQIPGINHFSGSANGKAQVVYKGKNWSTQAQGASPDYGVMHFSVPEIGRFFTFDEDQRRQRVAVIGATVVRELFGEDNPIGEMIKINRVNFQVIGILPTKGATGWRDQDDTIIVPLQTAVHRLFGRTYIDYIEMESADANTMDEMQSLIIETMNNHHHVPPSQKDGAFEVRNMADIQAAMAESSKTMSLLLSSIAAISLLVGGIGIMNIMLVSVTERTREIGLRKAIGARRQDIMFQFLSEAVVVSTVGGILGILVGWIITEILAALAGWTTSISMMSIAVAFLFSAGIGVLFGIYPARKASRLNPIEALRFE